MQRILATACIVAGLSLALPHPLPGQSTPDGPSYDSPETRRQVERMLEAHGYERWREVSAVGFSLAMYLPEISRMIPDRTEASAWRRYDVILAPSTSRGFVTVPWEGDRGPAAAFDGASVWGRGYTPDPMISDPPLQLLYMHSSFLRMPFLTQLDGARLTDGGTDSLPGLTDPLNVVRMTFEVQDSTEVTFRLFIDPGTDLLVGFEHDAFYPPLPGGIPALAFPHMPPGTTIARIIEARQTVEGIVLPHFYVSVAEDAEGVVRLSGTHHVLDVDLDASIDGRALVPASEELITITVDSGAP